jgi:hypothetical protein
VKGKEVAQLEAREETANSSMISVRIPQDVEDALKEEAAKGGTSLSELIRSRLDSRARAARGSASIAVFPQSVTFAASGLALENTGADLLPRTSLPFVSISHH